MRRYLEIAAQLQSECGELPPGTRLPGERELAVRFGVATPTIRQALRVLKDSGLLVRKIGSGTYTAGSCSNRSTIGVLVSGCRYSEIFAVMCREISHEAERHQMLTLIRDASCEDLERTADRTRELARELVASRVSGVIYQPVQFATSAFRTNCAVLDLFASAHIPVTVIDCELAECPIKLSYDIVSIDNFSAGQELATWLVQTGSRHICFQACPGYGASVADRIRGVRDVCHGIMPVLVLEPDDRAAVRRVLLENPAMDTVICQNDLAAVRLAEAFRELGRAVPGDIRVAGFDGVLASEKAGIPTMKQPCEDLARGALSCLLERMAHPTSSAMRLLRHARLLPRG